MAADGNFNYSADDYCNKYDESNGECPDGDSCTSLHRTAGDTERRYHLRYYKTGVCVHETDARGLCVKNGAHCAFAHGADDLRIPVFDRRFREMMEKCESEPVVPPGASGSVSSAPNCLDREHSLICEDPKWQDSNYVLAHYKTEPCKKPPRLCRQGYACPHYHNSKDKRRSPKKFKYRSTPCPSVKPADEWGDPTVCDQADSCQFCHSRTEQQFHPEIYKSTRCNDIQQSGYCPRAAFCAFAHVDQESVCVRELGGSERPALPNLADIVSSALHVSDKPGTPHLSTSALRNSMSDLNHSSVLVGGVVSNVAHKYRTMSGPPAPATCDPRYRVFESVQSHHFYNQQQQNLLDLHRYNQQQQQQQQMIHQQCQGWSVKGAGGQTVSSGGAAGYSRAPGSERDMEVLRRKIMDIDLDPDLDTMEKLRRKNSLFASMGAPLSSSLPAACMSPVRHVSGGGAGDTVVVGSEGEVSDVGRESNLVVDDDGDSDVITSIDREVELEEQRQRQFVQHTWSAKHAAPLLGGVSPPLNQQYMSGGGEARLASAVTACDRWRHLAEEQQTRASLAEHQLEDARRLLLANQRELDCYRRELVAVQSVLSAAASLTSGCDSMSSTGSLHSQLLITTDRLNQLLSPLGVCSAQHNNTVPASSTDNGSILPGSWLR